MVEVFAIARTWNRSMMVPPSMRTDGNGTSAQAPLFDPFALQTEHIGVVSQRSLHVTDIEHQVIQADDAHGAILAKARPSG